MDRNTILWALVLFFGATIAFQLVQRLTEDEHIAVTLALEVVVLVAIVAGVVLFVRRKGR